MKQFTVVRSLLINYIGGNPETPNLMPETFTIEAETAEDAIEIVKQKESRHHSVWSISAEEVIPAFGGEPGPFTVFIGEEVENTIDKILTASEASQEAGQADQLTEDKTFENGPQ
jgi:hypothetical protein